MIILPFMIYILLSTYNGKEYLEALLSSLLKQTNSHWVLLVRDDASDDRSLEIVQKFQAENKTIKINIVQSDLQNLGVKKSFSLLLNEALGYEDCEYIMFCDQDDVWLDNKIEKTYIAMKRLELKYPKKPLLVHTDLIVTDEKLNILKSSFWDYEHINPSKNGLNRLLIQNTITGCSMMVNIKLAVMAQDIPENAIMHDWWFGLVATEFGKIDFIEDATIKYRQHSSNDTGAKEFNLINIVKKTIALFLNDKLYEKHCKQAREFLHVYNDTLSRDTKDILEAFGDIATKPFWQRKQIAIRYKLLKQGYIRNIGLLIKI